MARASRTRLRATAQERACAAVLRGGAAAEGLLQMFYNYLFLNGILCGASMSRERLGRLSLRRR